MPGKKARRNAQPSPAPAPAGTDPLGPAKTQAGRELEVECANQLRRFGDKLNFRQKLLNLISKLFCSGT
ncbi:phorbol-12-myristate-13-acetate-induced protein 1 isoform X2 [Symphalangus syndactylus]|uniref:phorbol-12-myristate-13-acetate-induced protein 1 isoform X2 n=1 Tax=Symphalangus syndactylus TaxID=9590 RepID=UPI0024410A4E|nr:phorbol-12-myristate-13-acetate-induced protein 1 isoform X2 [Symphalangus syndactylus]